MRASTVVLAAGVALAAAPAAAAHAPTRHPYWYHPGIHFLGNSGLGGRAHAKIARCATGAINCSAYEGRDVRREFLQELPPEWSLCDLGCGVGCSTYSCDPAYVALARTVGVDASKEMIREAVWSKPDARALDSVSFVQANAETYGEDDAFDAAHVSFVLHEAPAEGRLAIVLNAMRIAKFVVCVTDICPAYTPSPSMLAGEPFVLDYLRQVESEMTKIAAATGWTLERRSVVEGHVVRWTFASLRARGRPGASRSLGVADRARVETLDEGRRALAA